MTYLAAFGFADNVSEVIFRFARDNAGSLTDFRSLLLLQRGLKESVRDKMSIKAVIVSRLERD